MAYPPKWKEFCSWLRVDQGSLPDHASLDELNRFAARYRLASAFEGLEVSGYPSATENAYGSVLKAFLAYSALEQLHKAVKPPSGSRNLMDRWVSLVTKPASQLRRSKSILFFLEEQVEAKNY